MQLYIYTVAVLIYYYFLIFLLIAQLPATRHATNYSLSSSESCVTLKLQHFMNMNIGGSYVTDIKHS
jgi:hypothetical protein